ncbi:MAG: ACT domain-containing protein [Gemmatimonadetes bacterium]|nr:ACT domain-containing protein [Gemmatimonadota bacterium]
MLDPVPYAFTRAPGGVVPEGVAPLVTVREAEALTLVLPRADAERLGVPLDFLARRIILTVHSDLAAVGMMARVATALAGAGIPCNAVAGAYHDHLFVPDADAAAMAAAARGPPGARRMRSSTR